MNRIKDRFQTIPVLSKFLLNAIAKVKGYENHRTGRKDSILNVSQITNTKTSLKTKILQ